MNVIAVIPARMGSARMPRKNLCEIEPGLTLLQQAIDCALHSGVIDEIAVSTDLEDADWEGTALWIKRPDYLCGPTSDISESVAYTLKQVEHLNGKHYDYIVTLQPAVIARSPLIVRDLVNAVCLGGNTAGITMAKTHRWTWDVKESTATNDWFPGPYPRSQDSAPRLVEINAVQVARRDVVLKNKRWDVPMVILELPSWCAALDIDTPEDLATARDLWPWARPRLETWQGRLNYIFCVGMSHICA